jgi:hypothetical protein
VELRVDALRHAAAEQQVGVVDIQRVGGAGRLRRRRRAATMFRFGPFGGPGLHALADEPHAVDVLVEADAAPTAPRLVKFSARGSEPLRGCSMSSVPTSDQVPELM